MGEIQTAVGIDPGARTALVCVTLDSGLVRWVGSEVVVPSNRKDCSVAENKSMLFQRALKALDWWAPSIIVIEEPLDAMGTWSLSNRRGRGQSRSTSFLLGEHYGLCLAAAKAMYLRGEKRIYSYPCTNYKGRRGWMASPRHGGFAISREQTLQNMRLYARSIGCTTGLSEDELMALGVLNFHLNSPISDL